MACVLLLINRNDSARFWHLLKLVQSRCRMNILNELDSIGFELRKRFLKGRVQCCITRSKIMLRTQNAKSKREFNLATVLTLFLLTGDEQKKYMYTVNWFWLLRWVLPNLSRSTLQACFATFSYFTPLYTLQETAWNEKCCVKREALPSVRKRLSG
jgi:hypothetical protein